MTGLPQADIDHVLIYGAAVWGGFANASFFVTGGTGFVGKWLLETLLAANRKHNLNIDITVLTRDAAKFHDAAPHIAGDVRIIEGDIRDFKFPGGSFTHIIHAATDMATNLPEGHRYDVIVQGTRRVLELAKKNKAQKFLLISSGAVYGRQPVTVTHLNETYIGEPHTEYGKGKLAAEALVGMQGTIARLFAVTGPYLPLDAGYAAGNFVRDRLASGPVHVSGDGSPLRSYLYAADMAVWLLTILAKGEAGQAYNVGAEEAVSIADLAHRIAKLDGGTSSVELAMPAKEGQTPDRYIPSIDKARSHLSLEQAISLDEGLSRMIAWNRPKVY